MQVSAAGMLGQCLQYYYTDVNNFWVDIFPKPFPAIYPH